MAQSEQQKAILALGKLLVKELGIETSVDTLSRWMAHYIAEKITKAEQLPNGHKKSEAEKECFHLILDLWKERWHFKPDKQPFKHFSHLFEILEKLDPDKPEPVYFRMSTDWDVNDSNNFSPSILKNASALALQIDQVARVWIDYVLREAASKTKDKEIHKLIEHAVKVPENIDARIIQIVLSKAVTENDDEQLQYDEARVNRETESRRLRKRIGELEKFKKLNEYLIAQYQKDLKKIVHTK